jgi:hypothetical protein
MQTLEPKMAPCHVLMERSQKHVLQHPPGTGAALALFPAAFQVIPMYVVANLIVLAMLSLWTLLFCRPHTARGGRG